MGLTGRVAIVTGGARGIGRAICIALAEQGADIVVADIDLVGAQETTREVVQRGARSLGLRTNVADRSSVQAMVRATLERFGHLDILVNNAGVCPVTPFEEIGEDEWRRVLSVNLTGPFLCMQEAVKVMAQSGWGRIVNISSVAGKIGGLRSSVHYAASKGGLIPMTFCIARQYAARGITANVVAPGQIDTDMIGHWSDETKGMFVAGIPVGRLGQPDDIAAAVAFLASEEAGFITGEILDVNGGFLMD